MYTNDYRKTSIFTAEQVAWIQRARHREHIEKLRRQTYEHSALAVNKRSKEVAVERSLRPSHTSS